MCSDFAHAVRKLWQTFADAFDPYRPERHYMRGPGPKWHAKRGGTVTAAADTTSLREIAGSHA
jgi:hypothetical protein